MSPKHTPSTEFVEFQIGYNSETTPPRVKILPPIDFLASNYPTIKFSSPKSKFSVFDTLAFFSTIINNIFELAQTCLRMRSVRTQRNAARSKKGSTGSTLDLPTLSQDLKFIDLYLLVIFCLIILKSSFESYYL